MNDDRLAFGGTKPGQYMAQEVPVIYGWGAAPAQRIYKSNEVVGINYTNEPVAHRQRGFHNYPENQVGIPGAVVLNEPTLEKMYQGSTSEGILHQTANKVFRNVNDPIDSRVVERKPFIL